MTERRENSGGKDNDGGVRAKDGDGGVRSRVGVVVVCEVAQDSTDARVSQGACLPAFLV